MAKCPKCHFEYRKSGECWCDDMKKPGTMNFIMDQIEPYYNRGLGEVVTSKNHYRSLLKEKNLVEVGNEWKYVDPDRVRRNKEAEQDKQLKAMRPEAHRMLSHYEGGR